MPDAPATADQDRPVSARGTGRPSPVAGGWTETSREDADLALTTLADRAPAWIGTDVAARIEILDELIADTLAAGAAWATAAAAAKGIRRGSPLLGEDWGSGVLPVLRQLALLRATLQDVLDTGRPRPPRMEVDPDGRVVVQVLPTDAADRLLFQGFTAEVRLQPGVTLEEAEARIGRIYRDAAVSEPSVCLVLGAGNVSSIGPMDALTELFGNDRVVLVKMSPVNAHLGPHIAEAFQALIRRGFLRLVYGGAELGAELTHHELVDRVHLTGSDRTHDAIVFGPGDEGRRRKQDGTPVLDKPISSELGSITPVIVVPGPWSERDLALQGDNIASMLVNNAGFNCIAARIVIQHRAWARRARLLDAVRASLRRAEQREPYVPGSVERWEGIVRAHPTAEWFGPDGAGRVPFTLIPDLDPAAEDDPMFTTEPFCGVFGEVALDAPRSIPAFLEQAVAFANERLWGNLAATIIVHPRSLADPEVARAVDRAVDDLAYGSVTINHWAAAPYAFVSPPWGAWPGNELTDIRSGRGVVHNTYLLEDVEKTVVRGPFRPLTTPLWFHTHRTAHEVLPRVAAYTATRDPALLPAILWHAARG